MVGIHVDCVAKDLSYWLMDLDLFINLFYHSSSNNNIVSKFIFTIVYILL